MSRIFLATFALVLGLNQVGFAIDAAMPNSAPGMWGAPPPSGLRFGATNISVRTADGEVVSGDSGAPADCAACNNGVCIDWKQRGWVQSWDEPEQHGGHRCRGGCR